MLKPSINLKLGVPLLAIAFAVSALALYGGAQLVKQDEVSADTTVSDGQGDVIGPGPVTVTIVAENILYDLSTLTANAGSEFKVIVDNRDAGVLHNIAFFTDRSASQRMFGSEIFTGPAIQENTFTAPAAPGRSMGRSPGRAGR